MVNLIKHLYYDFLDTFLYKHWALLVLVQEETTGIVTVRTWKTHEFYTYYVEIMSISAFCQHSKWLQGGLPAIANHLVYTVFCTFVRVVPACCCRTARCCSPGWWERGGKYQDGIVKVELLTPIGLLRHPVSENEMTSVQKTIMSK